MSQDYLHPTHVHSHLLPQDIPRTSDRAPSRTFYTWRVDWAASCERLAAELYRAAGTPGGGRAVCVCAHGPKRALYAVTYGHRLVSGGWTLRGGAGGGVSM